MAAAFSILLTVILAILTLFVFYPVLSLYRNLGKLEQITGNTRFLCISLKSPHPVLPGPSPAIFNIPNRLSPYLPSVERAFVVPTSYSPTLPFPSLGYCTQIFVLL
jgi:hypothetical protein